MTSYVSSALSTLPNIGQNHQVSSNLTSFWQFLCKEVVKKPITELMCDVIKKVAPRFLWNYDFSRKTFSVTESRKPSSSLRKPSLCALTDGPHCISMQIDSCYGCVEGEPCCWDKAPASFCQSLGECDQSHPNYLDCRKTCGKCCVQEKIG